VSTQYRQRGSLYSYFSDGDFVIVGAVGDDDKGSGSGSAYFFAPSTSGLWIPTQKITASDGESADEFSSSVAISGDFTIFGAPGDDDNGTDSGSAYLFERGTSGTWTQVQKITAADGATDDYFGGSVSISGDVGIVGALSDDDNGTDSGSAYLFERGTSGTWNHFMR
jgi:hypothetical protein